MCVNFQNKWIKWWRLQKTQWKIHLRDWQAKARLWTWSKTIEPVPVGCFGLVSTGVSAADAFLVLIIITDLQGILQPPHILRGQELGSPAILYLQIHSKNIFARKKSSAKRNFWQTLKFSLSQRTTSSLLSSRRFGVAIGKRTTCFKENVFLCQFHDSCGRKTGSKFLTWTMSTSPVSWQEIQLLGKIESANQRRRRNK